MKKQMQMVEKERRAGSYASVNGLNMYYEVHGAGEPLVLLHGALSAIGTSFGEMLPSFASTRKVIAVEQQGHGHTADIDRPLSVHNMAEDTVALLGLLGLKNVDIFGYSMGAGIALEIALHHPYIVRKLVLASLAYNSTDFILGSWKVSVRPGPRTWPGPGGS